MPVFLAYQGNPLSNSHPDAGLGLDYAAKGQSLGVRAFIKSGEIVKPVQGHQAQLVSGDTLQIIPLGASAQYVRLLGWSQASGWTAIFPATGQPSQAVTESSPPPGLVIQDENDARLICLSSRKPLEEAEALALLALPPYSQPDQAPVAQLHNGHYLQVFSISAPSSPEKSPTSLGSPSSAP
jgi:hypothetical protein